MDIYEPTLSHRIAVYLERLFSEYHVDCEYNKHLGKNKTITDYKNISKPRMDEKRKIRPDIIIHKERGKDIGNLAIFEIKKAGKNSKEALRDIEKLNDCLENGLNYKLAVFVGILKRKIEIYWIEKRNSIIETNTEVINS